MDHVVSILQASGPLTSAALANRLIQSKAVRNAAHARKLIERSRSRGTILSTAPVRFDKTFLYYLPAHRGSKYKKALISLLPQKPSYHRLFKGLLANKGWMTTGQVAKLTGCLPERVTHRAGGRAPLDAVLHELIHLGLLDRDAENRAILKTGEAFGRPAISKAAFLSKLQAEQILMPHFQAWLQNSFLIAYKSHSIRPNERGSTWFNDTAWDIHGPMYLGARAEAVDSRKTKRFLVAEMNGFRRFDKNDASSTIARLQSITSRWKTISLVPLTLSQAYSPDAFSQLRDGGVAAVTYKDVFGRNIEELMRLLDRTMQETDPEAQADNIERSLQIAEGTIASEDLIGHLKGALFEMIVALALRAEGYDVTLQKSATSPSYAVEVEIDVVANRGESICKLYECKGRNSKYHEDVKTVSRHFEHRCAVVTDPYGWGVTQRYKAVEAIVVTSGVLSEDAKAYAQSHACSHGITCRVIDRAELITWFGSIGQTRLLDIVKRFFR